VNDYRLVAKNVTAEFSDANHAAFTFTGKTLLGRVDTIAAEQNVYLLELLDLLQAIETAEPRAPPCAKGRLSLELARGRAAISRIRAAGGFWDEAVAIRHATICW